MYEAIIYDRRDKLSESLHRHWEHSQALAWAAIVKYLADMPTMADYLYCAQVNLV